MSSESGGSGNSTGAANMVEYNSDFEISEAVESVDNFSIEPDPSSLECSLSRSHATNVQMSQDMDTSDVLDGSWFRSNAPHYQQDNNKDRSENSRNSKRLLKNDSSEDLEELTNNQNIKRTKANPSPNNSNTFPTNATMMTQDKNITVLIKQIDNNRKFTFDPVGIANGFKDLGFNTIKDIRLNKRRNIIAVDFQNSNCKEMEVLLETVRLNKYGIQCYKPLDSSNFRSGVIGPVDLEVDLEEFKNLAENELTKILKMTRLPKFSSGRKEESLMIKVDFAGTSLPDRMFIDFFSYPVREYSPPPIMCYNCQRFGHMANGCTAKQRCLVCGNEHRKNECTAVTPRCANCGGPHIASHKNCEFVKNFKEIQILTRQENISFETARKKIMQKQKDNPSQVSITSASQYQHQHSQNLAQPTNINFISGSSQSGLKPITHTAEIHQSQGSYYLPRRYKPNAYKSFAETLITVPENNSQQHNDMAQPLPQLEVQSQMEIQKETIEFCKKHIESSINEIYLKLVNFLKEVFSLKLQEEQKRERELVLISIARNHFGAKIGETLLKELHTTDDPISEHQLPKDSNSASTITKDPIPNQNKPDPNNVNSDKKISQIPQGKYTNKTISSKSKPNSNLKQQTLVTRPNRKNARVSSK
jgi:hypothetical protein